MLCYIFLNLIVIYILKVYILKTYKDKSLFSESEPEDKNRTTDGDDGDGGKEDNSNDACNKDDKGIVDVDMASHNWLNIDMNIPSKSHQQNLLT